MRINGIPYRSIWVDSEDGWSVRIIDQTKLPWALVMERDAALLAATRPTAINLRWALDRMLTRLRNTPAAERERAAYAEAAAIADEDVAQNAAIGRHGLPLIEQAAKPGHRVNILTHCNAGRLATV